MTSCYVCVYQISFILFPHPSLSWGVITTIPHFIEEETDEVTCWRKLGREGQDSNPSHCEVSDRPMGHILGDPTTPLKVTSVLKPFLPPPCFSCPCCFSLSKPPALHTPPALRAPRPSAVLCLPAPAAQGQDAGDRPRPWSLPSQATRDYRTSVCSLCAYLLATKVPLPVSTP